MLDKALVCLVCFNKNCSYVRK